MKTNIKGLIKLSTVIGVFDDKGQAENAVNEIRNAGITEDRISIVGKEDRFEDDAGMRDQNLMRGTSTGGALGGLAGLLAGAGALTIPGIGPILAVGPLAAGLTGVAAGGLAGGLVDLGIPGDRGDYYENEVKKGGILGVVKTEGNSVEDISSYMRNNGAKDVESH